MNSKTDSIKGKLDIALISVLIVILVVPMVSMGILGLYGFVLSPQAYAEIIAAVATLLAVFLTLGLRLIDDTLNRYEKFAQPKIRDLSSLMWGQQVVGVSVTADLRSYRLFTLQGTVQKLVDSASALEKHGQFLFTNLYPKQLIAQTFEICGELKELLALIEEVKPYWAAQKYLEVFLQCLVLGHTDPADVYIDVYEKEFASITEKVKEISQKVESEKPTVVTQIRTLREKILQEIEIVTQGLDSFLEAN